MVFEFLNFIQPFRFYGLKKVFSKANFALNRGHFVKTSPPSFFNHMLRLICHMQDKINLKRLSDGDFNVMTFFIN